MNSDIWLTTAMKKQNKKSGKVFTTYLNDDGIIVTVVKPFSEVTIKDAEENTRFVVELTDDVPAPMLVDTRKIKSITKEARDHFAMRDRVPKVNSIGILIESPVSKLIGNFFMGLNKPKVPTRLFTTEEAALKWLEQYL